MTVWLKRLATALGLAVVGAIVVWVAGALLLLLIRWLDSLIAGSLILGLAVVIFIVALVADFAIDERRQQKLAEWNRDHT